MPMLLYSSENWILTDVLIEQLEAFQAELVKRVLKAKRPKHHSNTAAIVVLDVPTMGSGEEAGISDEGDGRQPEQKHTASSV